MRKLNSNTHNIAKTEASLRYLAVRLRSRPATEAMAEPIQAKRSAARAAYEAFQLASEESQGATAEINYRDGVLNARFMRLSRHALNMADGQRDAPMFKRLFPRAPSEMVDPMGGQEQAQAVRGVLQRIDEDDLYAELRPLAEALRVELDVLTEAEAKRQDARLIEQQRRAEYIVALEDAQRTYNLTYHHLKLMFPDDDALVESFFRA